MFPHVNYAGRHKLHLSKSAHSRNYPDAMKAGAIGPGLRFFLNGQGPALQEVGNQRAIYLQATVVAD